MVYIDAMDVIDKFGTYLSTGRIQDGVHWVLRVKNTFEEPEAGKI
jgi:hypothetical protein